MSTDDVSGGDMTPHDFSDDDAEAIISGFAPGEPELGAAFDELRSAFAAVEPPVAAGALNEFIVHVLEKELAQFEDAGSDEDITEKLRGLGYIS